MLFSFFLAYSSSSRGSPSRGPDPYPLPAKLRRMPISRNWVCRGSLTVGKSLRQMRLRWMPATPTTDAWYSPSVHQQAASPVMPQCCSSTSKPAPFCFFREGGLYSGYTLCSKRYAGLTYFEEQNLLLITICPFRPPPTSRHINGRREWDANAALFDKAPHLPTDIAPEVTGRGVGESPDNPVCSRGEILHLYSGRSTRRYYFLGT